MQETDPQSDLFEKNYVRLSLGSYRHWMLKEWHEFLVRKQWVKQNYNGQWSPLSGTLIQFCQYLNLYDKYIIAKDFNKKLEPEVYNKLVLEGLIKPQQ